MYFELMGDVPALSMLMMHANYVIQTIPKFSPDTCVDSPISHGSLSKPLCVP